MAQDVSVSVESPSNAMQSIPLRFFLLSSIAPPACYYVIILSQRSQPNPINHISMPHCQKEKHDRGGRSQKERSRLRSEKAAAKKKAAAEALLLAEEEAAGKGGSNNLSLPEGHGEYGELQASFCACAL